MNPAHYHLLTDDELLAVCDQHAANPLVTELAKRLNECLELIGHGALTCPKCGAEVPLDPQ